MHEKLSQILENATSQGYKSNVVKPLMGILIIMLTASIILAYLKVNGLSIACAVFAFLIVIVFLVGYFYCLFTNPDLLRSEKFVLEKTAIENVAFKGDSMSKGFLNAPELDYVKIESLKDLNKDE